MSEEILNLITKHKDKARLELLALLPDETPIGIINEIADMIFKLLLGFETDIRRNVT